MFEPTTAAQRGIARTIRRLRERRGWQGADLVDDADLVSGGARSASESAGGSGMPRTWPEAAGHEVATAIPLMLGVGSRYAEQMAERTWGDGIAQEATSRLDRLDVAGSDLATRQAIRAEVTRQLIAELGGGGIAPEVLAARAGAAEVRSEAGSRVRVMTGMEAALRGMDGAGTDPSAASASAE
ncbi:MAG: hypothetical protein ACYCST_09890 [Acidimicrobiales bacterium]